MKFDIGVITRHPFAVGGTILVVGGFVFYKIYKGRSAPAASSDLSSEAQFQQLQAAQSIAAGQQQAQVDLAAAQSQAQIAAINATYEGQAKVAEVGAAQYGSYLDAQKYIADSTNQAALQGEAIKAGTQIGIANIQASVLDQQAAIEQARVNAAELLGLTATAAPGTSLSLTSTGPTGTQQIGFDITGKGAYEQARGTAAQIAAAILGNSAYQYSQSKYPIPTGFNVSIPGVGSVGVATGG